MTTWSRSRSALADISWTPFGSSGLVELIAEHGDGDEQRADEE